MAEVKTIVRIKETYNIKILIEEVYTHRNTNETFQKDPGTHIMKYYNERAK